MRYIKDAQVGVSLWSKDHIERQPASKPTNTNNNSVAAVVDSQLPKLPPTVVFSYVPPVNGNTPTVVNNSKQVNIEADEIMKDDDTPGPNIVFKPIVNDNNYIPVTTSNNNNYSNNNRSNNNKDDEYERMELDDDDD